MLLSTFGTDLRPWAGTPSLALPAPPRFLPDPVPNSWKYRCSGKSRKFDSLLCSFDDFGANHEGECFGSETGILRELPRCCCVDAPRYFRCLSDAPGKKKIVTLIAPKKLVTWLLHLDSRSFAPKLAYEGSVTFLGLRPTKKIVTPKKIITRFSG